MRPKIGSGNQTTEHSAFDITFPPSAFQFRDQGKLCATGATDYESRATQSPERASMADTLEQQVSDFAPRARAISLLLTAWRSVTGTSEEAVFPQKLIALLSELPYFRTHPEDLRIVPIPGDALGRASVLALARGQGAETIVLAGHFDTRCRSPTTTTWRSRHAIRRPGGTSVSRFSSRSRSRPETSASAPMRSTPMPAMCWRRAGRDRGRHLVLNRTIDHL